MKTAKNYNETADRHFAAQRYYEAIDNYNKAIIYGNKGIRPQIMIWECRLYLNLHSSFLPRYTKIFSQAKSLPESERISSFTAIIESFDRIIESYNTKNLWYITPSIKYEIPNSHNHRPYSHPEDILTKEEIFSWIEQFKKDIKAKKLLEENLPLKNLLAAAMIFKAKEAGVCPNNGSADVNATTAPIVTETSDQPLCSGIGQKRQGALLEKSTETLKLSKSEKSDCLEIS